MSDLRCLVYAPYSFSGRGPAESCAQLAYGVSAAGVPISVHAGRIRTTLPIEATAPFAPLGSHIPWKYLKGPALRRLERQFTNALNRADPERTVAWFWPGSPESVVRHARALGIVTVREMINSALATSGPILDAAYRRLDLPATHGITADMIAAESDELKLYDFAFASNPEVEHSLERLGFGPERILRTTFGWSPPRFEGVAPIERTKFRAVFVGRIGVRKGIPDLLAAWELAGIEGELLLVGSVDPEIADLVARHVDSGRVRLFGYADNPAAVYGGSDVFVFPTLEEGGPQVTYEAAGCGLPVITTPMGAARLVENQRTGLVVDPAAPEQLAEAIRSLALDDAKRNALGTASLRASTAYSYSAVGAHRAELLCRASSGRAVDAR